MSLNKTLALILTLIVDFILLMLGAGTIAFLKIGGIFVFLIEFYFIRFIHRGVFAFFTKDNSINQELSHNHIEEDGMFIHKEKDFTTPPNLKTNIEDYEDFHPNELHNKKCYIKRTTVRSIYIALSIILGAIFIAFILWNKPYSGNKFGGYLYPIKENGLYGYIDSVGNRIIEPEYLWCSTFSNNLAMVVVDTIYKEVDDSLSYIAGETDSVIPKFRMFAKYGYIDKFGDFVIEPKFIAYVNMPEIGYVAKDMDDCSNALYRHSFRNKRAMFYDTTTWRNGYIDTKGDIAIEPKYYYSEPFRDDIAVVYDTCGKQLNTNGLCISRSKLRCAYIDTSGDLLTELKYHSLTSFSNNRGIGSFLVVNKANDYGFESWSTYRVLIDENINTIDTLSFLYNYYDYSDDGIAVAVPNPLFHSSFNLSCGFIDKSGNFISPLKNLSKARAAYLSNRNDIIQVCPTDISLINVTYFHDGLAGVTSDGEHWFFIDKDYVIHGYGDESIYEKISGFSNGLCAVKKNGKWGFVNNKIKELIPCKYDSCGRAYPYLQEAYDINNNGTVDKKYWINRFDSIVWKSKSNENISNIYSNKIKENWGKWTYVNSNKKVIDNNLLWIFATILVIFLIIICIVKFFNINNSKKYVEINRKYITIVITVFGVIIICISSHYILNYLLYDYSNISTSNIKKSLNYVRINDICGHNVRYEEERFCAEDSIGVKPKNTKWLKCGIGTLPSGKYISTYVGTVKDDYFAGYKTVKKYYSQSVPRYKTINYGYGLKDTYQDGWEEKKVPYIDYVPIHYDYLWQYAISTFDISDKLSLFCNEDSVYSNYLKEIERQLTSNYGYKFIYTKIDGKKALRYTTYDGTPIKRLIFCANGRAYVMETKSIGSLNGHSDKACSKIILHNFNIEEKDYRCMLISIICLLLGAIMVILTLIWYNSRMRIVNEKAHKLLVWSIGSASLNIALFLYATYSMYINFTISETLAQIQILGILSLILISIPLTYYYSSKEKLSMSNAWLVPSFLYQHMYSRINTDVYRKLFLTFAIYPIMVVTLLPCGLILYFYIIPILIISESLILLSRWIGWLKNNHTSDNVVSDNNETAIIVKITHILLAVALFLCLVPMPYDYYMFIRFIAMVVFEIIAYRYYKSNRIILCIIFISLALLFQPFIKVALGRVMWNVVDVVVAIGLVVLCLIEGKDK